MTSIFHIKAEELNQDFVDALKTLFKGKNITLTVDADMDETEFLLLNETNKEMLLKSLKQVEDGEMVSFTFEEFEKLNP